MLNSKLNVLKDLLDVITPEAWRFDAENDVDIHGNAFVYDVQDVSIARCYQHTLDTWKAKDNAMFIALSHELMPDLLETVKVLERVLNEAEAITKGSTTWPFAHQLLARLKKEEVIEEPKVNIIPVDWTMKGDNDGYLFGIEHHADEEIVHVEWFKNKIMRDMALDLYHGNEDETERKTWHHISNAVTRVFNDETNGTAWFLVGETLMGAPMNVDGIGIYTDEIFQPEDMPEWYQTFIKTILQEKEYQLNYSDKVFFDVLTDWLTLNSEYVTPYFANTKSSELYELTDKGFSFNGIEISNPTLSECGRFAVEPKEAYGFYVVQTGGGCTALQLDVKDGKYIWLTDENGSHVLPASVGQPFLMGLYNKDGEEIEIFKLKVGENLQD